jgi:tripartite-type tricarboxylate transporter receptor subunit TctC
MRSFVRQAVLLVTVAVVVAPMSLVPVAQADNYPSRDITFIVPFAPGGSADPISRQFTTQLEKLLPGSINIVNKPGGSATIGTGVVVRAKPDGYTLGLGANQALAYQPLLTANLPFKTPDDYQMIVKLVDLPACLFVRADAPWKTFEEFMADARKNPGKIRVSNAGVGVIGDLVIHQINMVTGVKLVTVPFTGGGGEALIALLGGRVEANSGYGPGCLGYVKAGKIRVLAVFMKGTYYPFPDAPSAFDAGYNATMPLTYYVIAPKGMPKDVVDRLVTASLRVARSEEFLKFTQANGLVCDAKGPEAAKGELVQYIKDFTALNNFLKERR